MAKALPFIHQPDGVAQRASDVSAADWRYQTGVKKYRIFPEVFLQLFSGLEIFVEHINTLYTAALRKVAGKKRKKACGNIVGTFFFYLRILEKSEKSHSRNEAS